MTTSVTPARGARCARGVSARALARADDARRATHARGAASNAMDKTRGETTTTTTTRRSGGRRRDARARASADDVEERVTSTRETTTGRFGNGNTTRRDALMAAASAAALRATGANAADDDARRLFEQRFPVLFKPFIGRGTRATVKRTIVPGQMWAFEQNIELGPLETTIRCVTCKLSDGSLWVHAPLAPTEEFFEFVESCGDGTSACVRYVVVPTYALEHKIFAKDALARWRGAKLYASPGQFTFPIRDVSDEIVFGKKVDFVLQGSDLDVRSPVAVPWKDEIEFETLEAGTFDVGSTKQTIYETAFFHKPSKTLIVTDALAQIPIDPPEANSVEKLLVVSQRSTADPVPEDTPEARRAGWEKTALLVSYFFPEHEELDPAAPGTVIWTDGWHDNFQALAGRLLVPPVVRTLLYAQNPNAVRRWVAAVSSRWDFERVVPAHWEAPLACSPGDFKRAFAFLDDDAIDAFPEGDLKHGLQPVADIVLKKK